VHVDLDLHRRPERRVDPAGQQQHVADLHLAQEDDRVEGDRDRLAARVSDGDDGGALVDQRQHAAAEDRAARVRVLGQDDLGHLHEGVGHGARRASPVHGSLLVRRFDRPL
jgi:hypothetical protein